jgi:hypothetical protein
LSGDVHVRLGPLEKGIGDVGKVFSGEILFAEELMSFEVS